MRSWRIIAAACVAGFVASGAAAQADRTQYFLDDEFVSAEAKRYLEAGRDPVQPGRPNPVAMLVVLSDAAQVRMGGVSYFVLSREPDCTNLAKSPVTVEAYSRTGVRSPTPRGAAWDAVTAYAMGPRVDAFMAFECRIAAGERLLAIPPVERDPATQSPVGREAAIAAARRLLAAEGAERARAANAPFALTDALAVWVACQIDVMAVQVDGPLEPEAVADVALNACAGAQAKAAALADGDRTPDGRSFSDLKRAFRSQIAGQVREIRGGAKPVRDWGVCIGAHLRAEGPGPETAEAVADEGLRACEALERRAGAYVERAMGRERGAGAMAELRRRQREDSINRVLQMRAERLAPARR